MAEDKEKGPIPEVSEPTRSPSVFLSHDSDDAQLAEAFDNLLRACSGGFVRTFRSSDRTGQSGIPYGDDWFKWIMEHLKSCSDVVALLTPRSADRPWILYEVGVAKGQVNTTVLGLAVGMPLSSIDGPFRAWQNCECDEVSLVGLVKQIITRRTGADPSEKAIRTHVGEFLAQVEQLDLKTPETPSAGSSDEPATVNTVARYFEEIKAMLRPGIVNRVSTLPEGMAVLTEETMTLLEEACAVAASTKSPRDVSRFLDLLQAWVPTAGHPVLVDALEKCHVMGQMANMDVRNYPAVGRLLRHLYDYLPGRIQRLMQYLLDSLASE